jgi:L-threonylcarbamoyladenylate synthase
MKTVSIDQTIDMLASGGIGVLPTDTVYGVVASAANEQAVKRLYELKKRDQKPGTIIAASIEQLESIGFKRRYLTAVQQFWPNPISVVVPCETPYLHLGKYAVAVRIPKDETIQKLLQQTGPLLTSSANTPGEQPATTIAEAKAYFDDCVDFYVDGGKLSNDHASTIIRIVDDAVEVLSQGAVRVTEAGKVESGE